MQRGELATVELFLSSQGADSAACAHTFQEVAAHFPPDVVRARSPPCLWCGVEHRRGVPTVL